MLRGVSTHWGAYSTCSLWCTRLGHNGWLKGAPMPTAGGRCQLPANVPVPIHTLHCSAAFAHRRLRRDPTQGSCCGTTTRGQSRRAEPQRELTQAPGRDRPVLAPRCEASQFSTGGGRLTLMSRYTTSLECRYSRAETISAP